MTRLTRLRRIFANPAGNVVMIVALLAPLLVVAAGGAIDVTNASMRQAQLQAAVDAAAVAAVARNSPAYLAALQLPSTGTVAVTAPNEVANVQAIFDANRRNSNDTSVLPVTVAVTKTGTVVRSVVSDQGTFAPSFLGLIGMRTIALAATSHASDNIPAYMNFYLLLDNTPSQGVAATATGIQSLQTFTPNQCAFACHDVNNMNSNYLIAKQHGIATRINNVAAAAANLLSTAQSTETSNGLASEFSVAIYDFGVAAANPQVAALPNQVYPQLFGTVSTNLSAAAAAAASIDLMTVQGNDPYDVDNDQYGDKDTNLQSPLNFAAQTLTSSGNGASALTPQNVIFFVSDGLNDTYNCNYSAAGQGCRQITPLDPTPCNTLKNNGVTVAVLYTTYLPLPNNGFWQNTVQPYTTPNDQIASAMKQCASPNLYFEVNSNQDINAAMQTLFQRVIASVKITG